MNTTTTDNSMRELITPLYLIGTLGVLLALIGPIGLIVWGLLGVDCLMRHRKKMIKRREDEFYNKYIKWGNYNDK